MSYGSQDRFEGKGQTFDEALRNAQREANGPGPTKVRVRVESIEVEKGDLVVPPVVVSVSVVE